MLLNNPNLDVTWEAGTYLILQYGVIGEGPRWGNSRSGSRGTRSLSDTDEENPARSVTFLEKQGEAGENPGDRQQQPDNLTSRKQQTPQTTETDGQGPKLRQGGHPNKKSEESEGLLTKNIEGTDMRVINLSSFPLAPRHKSITERHVFFPH